MFNSAREAFWWFASWLFMGFAYYSLYKEHKYRKVDRRKALEWLLSAVVAMLVSAVVIINYI